MLCTLGEGSVFGEIALLGVGGMNKRTADVISVGYSNLFVLKKEDLEMVLEDYPDAKRILNARAKRLIRENEARLREEREDLRRAREARERNQEMEERVLFPVGNRMRRGRSQVNPALLEAVMEALPRESTAIRLLKEGGKEGRRKSSTRSEEGEKECKSGWVMSPSSLSLPLHGCRAAIMKHLSLEDAQLTSASSAVSSSVDISEKPEKMVSLPSTPAASTCIDAEEEEDEAVATANSCC